MAKQTIRRFLGMMAVALAALLSGVGVANAGTIEQYAYGNAWIGSGCSGGVVGQWSWDTGNAKMYYSSANGGTNCLIAYNTSGSPMTMSVYLRDQWDADVAYDKGLYSQFAGSVHVGTTSSHCLYFDVEILRPSGWVTVAWGSNVFCGARVAQP